MQFPSGRGARAVLAAGGLGAVFRGVAYAPWTKVAGDRPEQLGSVDKWFPPAMWSWVWIAVGIMLIISVWWRPLTRTAMSLMTGLLTAWGVSYCFSWVFEQTQRSWVTGTLFLMAAVWSGVLTSLLERRGP
ncbi:hypothetical protein [Tomitella gaofuii]|uniref:hypothetical protein n=1 Tax=Tomitella gaofuii TaxID=2760083 RepID=UPI0015FE00FC|nr:hypothetical protein [Tomitella gaofuii]